MKEHKSFLVILLPWLLFFAVFTIGMVGYNLVVSFTDWHGIFPSFNFEGLGNYVALFKTDGFLESIKNVLLLFCIGLPLSIVISILLGVVIDQLTGWMSSTLRSISIISMALGGSTVSLFWNWMFNYRYGGINSVLRDLGLARSAVDWLGNGNFVMFAIIIMLVWKFCGYGGLIVYGGLLNVPKTHIEAAQLDGAGQGTIFLKVMLPQVKGQIFTLFLLMSMYLLQSFGYIWPLTGGGPGWASTLLPELAYRKMFESYDFAGGAAVANIMFLLVSFIAIPYLRYTKKENS
jgi:ABC-type sugar transport system permease subunit